MNNSQDPKFSKFSYVNKDFASIYPDLLDLASTLTDKWHPANSNESDPGVVLLKEGAFMADHINYNTDKNILEAFLPTATQESSVRDLVQRGGYLPNYYISGKGKVNFTYTFEDENKSLINKIIPSLTLNITNKEGSVSYVQIEPLKIDESGHGYCNFIEGFVEDFEINGSKTITLENIDDDLRLYLPTNNIAQNGILIRNADINPDVDWSTETELWQREVFLNVLPQYTKAYRVEYDSEKDKVYIEFPSDLSAIIGSGLNIKYIVSTGLKGNIPANHLTVISSPTMVKFGEIDYSMSNFTLYNPGAIENGKDPETIKEMYHNFKETVGTFNTLVTCRDYSNAIKSMVNDNNDRIVSNAVVTDCTNDYSNTVNIVTYDEYGKYIKPALKRDLVKLFDQLQSEYPYNEDSISVNLDRSRFAQFLALIQKYEGMENNDLKLCALQPYVSGKYKWDDPASLMESTYDPILPEYTLDSERDGITTLNGIKNTLKDYKCISTSFKSKTDGEVYYFKVKTPLHIQVTTYDKITSKSEFESIQQSIYKTITEKYNSGMIEFGDSLNLDEVYQAILNADERIKNIYITQEDDETETEVVKFGLNNGTPEIKEEVLDTINGKELIIELLAKNVLSGRLCLFNFINDFNYNYGQGENKFYGASDSSSTSYSGGSTVDSDPILGINTDTKIFISNIDEGEQRSLPTDYTEISYSQGLDLSDRTVYNNSTTIIELDSTITLTYEDSSTIELSGTIGITNLTGQDLNLDGNAKGLIFYKLSEGWKNDLSLTFNIDRDNHYLYLAKPNYVDDKVFPTYCYYKLTGPADADINKVIIPANKDTKIPAGYVLYLAYKKDSTNVLVPFKAGSNILSTVDISLKEFYQLPEGETNPELKAISDANRRYLSNLGDLGDQGKGFKIISAGNSIRSRVLLRTSIQDRVLPCYWIRSNPGCTLFNYTISKTTGEIEPGDSSTFLFNDEVCTILNNNEYFFYTDQQRNDLVMFGPGTMVSIPESYAVKVKEKDGFSWGINPEDQLSLEGIESKGISAGIPFIDLNLKSEDPSIKYNLNLTEMEITTLTKDDSLTLKPGEDIKDSFTFGFGTTWYPIVKAGTLSYYMNEGDGESSEVATDAGVFIKTEFMITSNPVIFYNSCTDNCYITEEIDYNGDKSIKPVGVGNILKVMSSLDLSGLSSSLVALDTKDYTANLKLMTYEPKIIKVIKDDVDYIYPGNTPIPDNYVETAEYEELSFNSNENNGSSFEVRVPVFFNRGCLAPEPIGEGENTDTPPDLHNNYIIPVLLSGDYSKLADKLVISIYMGDRVKDIYLKTGEFGKSGLNTHFNFKTNQNFYQFTFDIDDEDLNQDSELTIIFSYNGFNSYNPRFESSVENNIATVSWENNNKLNAITLYKMNQDNTVETETEITPITAISCDIDTVGSYILKLETDDSIYNYSFTIENDWTISNEDTSLESLINPYEMMVSVLPIKVYNGANKKISLSDNTLDEIVAVMNNMVANSTYPDTNIYYINEPDNTIDIQNEEILVPNTNSFNPNFLYDKNNVANNQVLPMIDLARTDIFLTKSVKGYRE